MSHLPSFLESLHAYSDLGVEMYNFLPALSCPTFYLRRRNQCGKSAKPADTYPERSTCSGCSRRENVAPKITRSPESFHRQNTNVCTRMDRQTTQHSRSSTTALDQRGTEPCHADGHRSLPELNSSLIGLIFPRQQKGEY